MNGRASADRYHEYADEIDAIADGGRLRHRRVIDSGNGRTITMCSGANAGTRQKLINWASNDYLGNATRIQVRNGAIRALRTYGSGSGSARLLSGGVRVHRRLEQRLSGFLGYDDALLTTTGYQANLAALSALMSFSEDAIILDRLCHASTYDGARLSAAGLLRFHHNNVDDLRKKLRSCESARRRMVCVESIYSMDGDAAPLADIAAVCREYDALLLVDEAHAFGVYGPGGRGLCAEAGVIPDLLVTTCSKSLGSQGGVIAGPQVLIDVIVNRGRSFIFSTAPVPGASGAALASLDRLRDTPEQGASLLAAAAGLRADLKELDLQLGDGIGPIIPVLIGSEERTLEVAAAMEQAGHFTPAIRPPTVPPGSCRLRLTLTLAHTPADCRRLVQALATAMA